MGIRFYCPNGHKLNVKEFQAGQRGICPKCHATFDIPFESTRPAGSKDLPVAQEWEIRAKREGLYPFGNQVASNGFATSQETGETGPGIDILPSVPQAVVETKPVKTTSSGSSDGIFNFSALSQSTSAAPVASAPAAPVAPVIPKTSSDPFDGPADCVWFLQTSSGEQHGPISGETMRTWLNENRITPDMLVWRSDWTDWKTAGSVFGTFSSAQNSFGF